MEQPYDVTIGMPVYNVEKYIRGAMDSALGQSFPNIEFLVVDDCGTDASIDIVQEYQLSHPRGAAIRVVRQPHNMGVGMARNRIIDEAKGKYLFFFDPDDELMPKAIETLHEQALRYDADIIYGSHERVELFGDMKKVTAFLYPSRQFLGEDDFPGYAYQRYENIQAQTWNFLIKTEIYRRNKIRYKQLNFWEDFTTTIDLPTYIGRAVLLPDITYRYYCRSGSLSNYQQRKHIDKQEILKTIEAMAQVKQNSERLRSKSYFPKRLYKVMLTHFYIACAILRQKGVIDPRFSNREIRDLMLSPLSFRETLCLHEWRFKNMSLSLLGILPPWLSVVMMKLIGKERRLV